MFQVFGPHYSTETGTMTVRIWLSTQLKFRVVGSPRISELRPAGSGTPLSHTCSGHTAAVSWWWDLESRAHKDLVLWVSGSALVLKSLTICSVNPSFEREVGWSSRAPTRAFEPWLRDVLLPATSLGGDTGCLIPNPWLTGSNPASSQPLPRLRCSRGHRWEPMHRFSGSYPTLGGSPTAFGRQLGRSASHPPWPSMKGIPMRRVQSLDGHRE